MISDIIIFIFENSNRDFFILQIIRNLSRTNVAVDIIIEINRVSCFIILVPQVIRIFECINEKPNFSEIAGN